MEVSWYGSVAQDALEDSSEKLDNMRVQHHLAIWLLVGSRELRGYVKRNQTAIQWMHDVD